MTKIVKVAYASDTEAYTLGNGSTNYHGEEFLELGNHLNDSVVIDPIENKDGDILVFTEASPNVRLKIKAQTVHRVYYE